MGNRWSLVSSRVGLAIVGAVVVGGISAAVAAGPMLLRGTARADTAQSQTNASPSADATTNATASPEQSATSADTPETTSTTATPRPTRTPRPTPTPGPTATPAISLQGSVVSTNPTFVLHLSTGPTQTVIVNAGTVFRGCAQSLSTLGIGWNVVVTGAHQADGTFLASRVDSDGNCPDT